MMPESDIGAHHLFGLYLRHRLREDGFQPARGQSHGARMDERDQQTNEGPEKKAYSKVHHSRNPSNGQIG
jgi:hypothetical protein